MSTTVREQLLACVAERQGIDLCGEFQEMLNNDADQMLVIARRVFEDGFGEDWKAHWEAFLASDLCGAVCEAATALTCSREVHFGGGPVDDPTWQDINLNVTFDTGHRDELPAVRLRISANDCTTDWCTTVGELVVAMVHVPHA